MTTTKHTPGPWRYERANASPTTGEHMIAGGKPGYIAEVRDCGSGCVRANARLIAAAPDLLEALGRMLEEFDDATVLEEFDDATVPDDIKSKAGWSGNTVNALFMARAAIAKARGEN